MIICVEDNRFLSLSLIRCGTPWVRTCTSNILDFGYCFIEYIGVYETTIDRRICVRHYFDEASSLQGIGLDCLVRPILGS